MAVEEEVFSWPPPKGSRLEAVYRFVRGGELESAGARLVVGLGKNTSAGFVGRYDLVSGGFVERGVNLRVGGGCGCWALDLGFVARVNPDEDQFRVLVELSGLGGIGRSVEDVRGPDPGGVGRPGGLWRPGW